MPTFDFNSPLYKAYGQRSTKRTPTPSAPSTPVQAGGGGRLDIAALLQALLAGQTQQSQMAQQSEREAQGGIHRDMSGRPIDQTAPAPGQFGSPITFPSAEQRYADMAKYPSVRVPPRTDYSNPYFVGELPPAPTPAPTQAPQVGSWIPSQQPGIYDFVGPKDSTSGGGNLLGQAQLGSATAAPRMPGYSMTPAGNAVQNPTTPRPKMRGNFRFGGFR